MTVPAYPPARTAAVRVEAHLVRNHDEAQQRGQKGLAPLPRAGDIEVIIDVAFWASLLREEGRDPQISIAYLPPVVAGQVMLFERPIPFTAEALARLSPAVVRPGIHLGVWPVDGTFVVWGTTRSLPCFCLVLEVVEPGLLVVKYRRGEGAVKFGNLAVLRGDEIKIVDYRAARAREYPPVLQSLLSLDSSASLRESAAVLAQLCVSMRGHGHGGALLVVPDGSDAWLDSIVRPIPYLLKPPQTSLSDLMRTDPEEKEDLAFQESIRRAVDATAGLTAVDGATVISNTFDVLAFGVKIGRAVESTPVEQLVLTQPVEGNSPTVVYPTQVGGTRHLSAAQFAYDQRDALALVASQDGRFTIFAWSPRREKVRAHRIEALLL